MNIEPYGYITEESASLMLHGGNKSRKTVPLHAYKSRVAKLPIYTAADHETLLKELRRLKKLLADANRGAERNAHINLGLAKMVEAAREEGRRERTREIAKLLTEYFDFTLARDFIMPNYPEAFKEEK